MQDIPRARFKAKDQLRETIKAFIQKHNERAKPFRWRKREVKDKRQANSIRTDQAAWSLASRS